MTISEETRNREKITRIMVGVDPRPGKMWRHFLMQTAAANSRRDQAEISKTNLIRAIRALQRAGIPLGSGMLSIDKSEQTRLTLARYFKKEVCGWVLLYRAKKAFGSWQTALKKANVSVRPASEARSWRPEEVVACIRELRAAWISVNCAGVRRNGQGVSTVLTRVMGRATSGDSLYRAARAIFGSWDTALYSADLEPAQIRRRGENVPRRRSLVRRCIGALHRQGFRTNYASMVRRAALVRVLVWRAIRRCFGGCGILAAGKKVFGSWDNALIGAGLCLDEIRIRRRPLSDLPIIPHQTEVTTNKDGSYRKVRYFGQPPQTPLELLERREMALSIEAALGELSCEARGHVLKLFDSVLDGDAKVGTRTGLSFDAHRALTQLGNSGAFADYREDRVNR